MERLLDNMATCQFRKSYILAVSIKRLQFYLDERDASRKAICNKYVRQYNFLRRVFPWLKPITYKMFQKDHVKYCNLHELLTYDLLYIKQIDFMKSLIAMCSNGSGNVTLSHDECRILAI